MFAIVYCVTTEPPRVTLNVGPVLSLTLGQEQKLVCDTQGYYPLDVTIEWLRESVGSGLVPEVLKNILYSSHRHHQDGTYSLSAFFLLRPGLKDSEYKYTCRVQHQSLRTPIRKSFTLIVTGRIQHTRLHSSINYMAFIMYSEKKLELPIVETPKVTYFYH